MRVGYLVLTDIGPHFENGYSTIQIGTIHKAVDLGTLLDHFGIDHTRRINGQVVPFHHEYPKDLFADAAKNPK